jgi:NitT/TauT family transport system permease protein
MCGKPGWPAGGRGHEAGAVVKRLADNAIIVLVILAGWQGLFAYAGDVAITSPSVTFTFAAGLLGQASFYGHVGATLLAFLYALVISAIGGIALGLLLGLRRFAGDVAEPVIASLYTIPKVTLYPVMLLVFGLGLSAKVAFGVIHGMIPVILFTLAAVKNIPPVLLRTARALRLQPMQTATTVLAPAVMPEIVTGLRIGFALTLLGVLIGEMFASQRGLGFLIINGINSHDVRMTTSVTLIVIVFAVCANGAMLALDRAAHHAR